VYEEGVLLPQDMKKATKYFQKGIKGKESYAYYRFAMAKISGDIREQGVSADDIEAGFKLLNQAAFELDDPVNIGICRVLKPLLNWANCTRTEDSALTKRVCSLFLLTSGKP
jgi:hypothetical protein